MREKSTDLETTGRACILLQQRRNGLGADGGVQPCNVVKNLGELAQASNSRCRLVVGDDIAGSG